MSAAEKVIISFDVGIRNLALCVLSQSTDGIIRILYWRWMDVTDPNSDAPKPKKKKKLEAGTEMGACQGTIKKTKKQCGKRAPANSKGKFLCGVHNPARKHTPDMTQEWTYALLIALPKLAEEITAVIPENADVRVIIERQTSANPKMLLQGNLIYGFWVSFYKNAVPVNFVPAYNKGLLYPEDAPEIPCTLKGAYARRKFFSRKHCEYFLTEREELREWLPFFTASKKSDDCADALNQAIYVFTGASTRKPDTAGTKKYRKRKIRF